MNQKEKKKHMYYLWETAFVKAKAGANVLKLLQDLSGNIIKFGIRKRIEEL